MSASTTGREPNASGPTTHPHHYNAHPSGVECLEIVEALPFNLGNAVKYAWRADLKGAPVADLDKALFYLRRERRFASGFDKATYGFAIRTQATFYRHDVRQLLLHVSQHGVDPLRTIVDVLAMMLGGGIAPVAGLDRCIAAVETAKATPAEVGS